jgi:hypothetical protein
VASLVKQGMNLLELLVYQQQLQNNTSFKYTQGIIHISSHNYHNGSQDSIVSMLTMPQTV